MSTSKGYIVKREVQDNGPMGSVYGYVKVTRPNPGETIYHGAFKPVNVDCGQFDADTRVEYHPVGEVTSEPFSEGIETF